MVPSKCTRTEARRPRPPRCGRRTSGRCSRPLRRGVERRVRDGDARRHASPPSSWRERTRARDEEDGGGERRRPRTSRAWRRRTRRWRSSRRRRRAASRRRRTRLIVRKGVRTSGEPLTSREPPEAQARLGRVALDRQREGRRGRAHAAPSVEGRLQGDCRVSSWRSRGRPTTSPRGCRPRCPRSAATRSFVARRDAGRAAPPSAQRGSSARCLHAGRRRPERAARAKRANST